MKKLFLILLLSISIHSLAHSWGLLGHRIIGEIAQRHLGSKARKEIKKILGNESLAISSTWMDFIRSDSSYDYTHPWHYVTIPDGKTYEEAEKAVEGDVIVAIEQLVNDLKSGELTEDKKKEAIRFLVHLIGDIHQPLHVGRGTDRGGNDVQLTWFNEKANLHQVWDSKIIDYQQLNYTEYTRALDFATKKEIKKWQASSVRDWAYEAMDLREEIYDLPEDGRLFYQYNYNHIGTIEKKLLKAGIRLAGVLNEIFE